jgi:hypothetical protein
MVKPPLRTKSIGFKVSEEEYAQLETAAQADGRTLGEWCREVILRGGSASEDPALAEIIGVRLLLVNVLGPVAAGEKVTPEKFNQLLESRHSVRRREYVATLRRHKMVLSMSRPANPYDNANCESFIKTLKREEIYANEYENLEHLRSNVEEFIERYYNKKRLHSALGYRSPEEFEEQVRRESETQQSVLQ